ncbi:hypothetical protein SOASR031_37190 [Leminorella grimontii]|nr:hypothetical protein SOASR031_37190 [Leminorella grimontii]
MALTLEQELALLALLSEKKTTLSELPAATGLGADDLMLTRQGIIDKSITGDVLKRYVMPPDASLTASGVVQLSNDVNSYDETKAATPKAVKAAYNLADSKYVAQDATTAQKGIVQLSSLADSASESLAATPKAVKTAYDLAAAALPCSGGTMTGSVLSTSRAGAGSYASQNVVSAPYYQEFSSVSSSEYNPLWKQKHTTGMTWSGGSLVSAGNFNIQGISQTGSMAMFTFASNGQFIPGSYANFDARYANKNTASKTANGWWKCGSTGLIIQWGIVSNSITAGLVTVNFPIAFPSAALMAIGYTYHAHATGEDGISASAKPLSKSQLRVTLDNGVPTVWFAIGY